MPERKIVSSAELNTWLTDEIRKAETCHECELTWRYRLRHPKDHDGCNWSEVSLRLAEDADRDVAIKAAVEIEGRAFKLFNLAEETLPPTRSAHAMPAMSFLRRLLFTPMLHLDTNLINARQKNDAVNQLEKWHADGVICLAMSGVAHEEAQAGAGGEARKRKAFTHIFTITEAGDVSEDDTAAQVEKILFGKATDDNQANDVEIVCEAIKFNAILVTNDGGSKTQRGGILGNREKLHQQFDIAIYRPEEAVEFVRAAITERDQFNARVAETTGAEPPEWTGRD